MKLYLFLLLCLLCSCSEQLYEEALNNHKPTLLSLNEVKALIEQARWGDGAASLKLAECYREGNGVKKDFASMLAMLAFADRQGGTRGIEAYLYSLPKDDNNRRMYDVIKNFSQGRKEKADSIMSLMDAQDTPDLRVIQAIIAVEKGDSVGGAQMLQATIAQEGSLGALMWGFLAIKSGSDSDLECLAELADEHPLVNVVLGDFYLKRETATTENKKLAAHYYKKAYEYAMLSKRRVLWLLSYYEEGGDIQLSNLDIQRLKILAGIDSVRHSRK